MIILIPIRILIRIPKILTLVLLMIIMMITDCENVNHSTIILLGLFFSHSIFYLIMELFIHCDSQKLCHSFNSCFKQEQIEQSFHLLQTLSPITYPEFKQCTYQGIEFDHATNWTSPFDPCDHCNCTDGQVKCMREVCDIQCDYPVPHQTECCHECTGNVSLIC